MFFSILQLMLIPLCIWIKILLIELAFESHQSVGQTKIDALSLSTCHQYRRYLENQNAAINLKIELQQTLMTTRVALCAAEALALATAGGPPAYTARMRLCNLQLLPLELTGRALIKTQEISFRAFILSQKLSFNALRKSNRLDSKITYNIPQIQEAPMGLKRRPLSFGHQASETLIAGFGPKRHWPKIWVAKPSRFSQEFSVMVDHHLEVHLFKDDLSMNTSSSKQIQNSHCYLIEKKAGYEYEVKR